MMKVAAIFLLLCGAISGQECEDFRPGQVCELTIDNVLEIEGRAMGTEQECQYACFRDAYCGYFTFFERSLQEVLANGEDEDRRKKCVLFKECGRPAPCPSCFTGPAMPSVSECRNEISQEDDVSYADPEDTAYVDDGLTTSGIPDLPQYDDEYYVDDIMTTTVTERPTTTLSTTEASSRPPTITTLRSTFRVPGRPSSGEEEPTQREPKQFEDEADDEDIEEATETDNQVDIEDDDDVFDVVGIDEGLLRGEEDPVDLPEDSGESPDDESTTERDRDYEEAFPDEYFDEDAEQVTPRPDTESTEGRNETRRPPYFHCVMGGYGPQGPMPSVSHVVPNQRRRTRLIPSLPVSFPLGMEGIYSSIVDSKQMFACSPGAITTSVPTGGSFFNFNPFPSTPTLQSGRCYTYSRGLQQWQPYGSPMNTFRGGSSIVRMGRFFVATGGRRFPSSLDSIEVLNTRKPQRWRTLSKMSLPNPTFDHCAVAINKTSMMITGGVGQESQATVLNLRTKRMIVEKPMKQPRRKHSCAKARVNGRPGVIVAGGTSDAVQALSSVEFFDAKTGDWMSLGRMRAGRRFPGLLVIGGNLVVAGGEMTDPLGRTVIMDDMETLRGRSWRPVRQRLSQPRSRFTTLRVPLRFFDAQG